MKRQLRSTQELLAVIPLLLVAAGCAGSSPLNVASWKSPWNKSDQPKPYPNPVKMAATWAPDTLLQSGRTPTRGFGGRLFFYDEKLRAVPVEGDLTVHGFVENPDGSTGEVKRYHFTAEQFTRHFSQSDLGASYSVWIPWDAVGGDQTKISLVPSFRTSSGKLVQGETALVGLPGKRNKVENIAKRPDPRAALAAQRDLNKSGLTTTTIPIRGGNVPQSQQMPAAALAERVALSHGAPSAAVERQSPVAQTGQPGAAPQRSAPSAVAEARQERFGNPPRPMRLGEGVQPASAALPDEGN